MLYPEQIFHGRACSPSMTVPTKIAGVPATVTTNAVILHSQDAVVWHLKFHQFGRCCQMRAFIRGGLLRAGLTSSIAMTGPRPLSATVTKAPASLSSPSTTSTLGLISLGALCKQLRYFNNPASFAYRSYCTSNTSGNQQIIHFFCQHLVL